MLKRPARKPNATARPRKMYGTVATSVSGNARGLVKAPWNRAVVAAIASEPVTWIAMPATRNPHKTETRGMRRAEISRRRSARLTSSGGSGHQQPDAIAIGILLFENRYQTAAVHDGHAVGQGQHLAQLRCHQEHCHTVVPFLDHSSMDELDRPDVHASGRLAREQHLG